MYIFTTPVLRSLVIVRTAEYRAVNNLYDVVADVAMEDLPHLAARHLDRKYVEWSRPCKINSTHCLWLIAIIMYVFSVTLPVRQRAPANGLQSTTGNDFCEIDEKKLALHGYYADWRSDRVHA